MRRSAEAEIELRELRASDKVTGLSLGAAEYAPLKTFVPQRAKSYSEQMLAKTYVGYDGTRLVGYVTLVCGQIEVEGGEPSPDLGGARYDYTHYPAVKVARLAVHVDYRGAGLGRTLLDFSLGVARDTIATSVGCRFVVLDAKATSVPFYEKHGFRRINTPGNLACRQPVMFLDLKGTSAPSGR